MAIRRGKTAMARVMREQEREGLAKLAKMSRADRAAFWETVNVGSDPGAQLARTAKAATSGAKKVSSRVLFTPSAAKGLGPGQKALGPGVEAAFEAEAAGVGGGAEAGYAGQKLLTGQGPKSFMQKIGGKAGMAGIGLFLADLLKNQGMDAYGMGKQADLQGQQMEAQGEAATPENFLIQALLPSSEQQKQQAMQALMQQLTGGNAPRQLARGEVLT